MMKHCRPLHLGLLVLGFITACSRPQAEEPDWTFGRVDTLEARLRQMSQLDTTLVDSLAAGYKTLAARDTLADSTKAKLWLRRGDVYRAFQGPRDQQALAAYRRVVDSFAYTSQAAQAALASGLLYERRGNTPMAAGAYRLILDRFPSSSLADDAQNLLDLLRQSPDQQKEQIKRWIEESDTANSADA
jgi:tetratricopeptide (TPR) repeat protein